MPPSIYPYPNATTFKAARKAGCNPGGGDHDPVARRTASKWLGRLHRFKDWTTAVWPSPTTRSMRFGMPFQTSYGRDPALRSSAAERWHLSGRHLRPWSPEHRLGHRSDGYTRNHVPSLWVTSPAGGNSSKAAGELLAIRQFNAEDDRACLLLRCNLISTRASSVG